MTVAWVITREGPQHPTEVIGILSKRKSAHIKEYVEWFCALLHYDPGEHLAFSRYNNPTFPYKAQVWPVNPYMVWCGDIIACLGRNISLIESCGKESVLKWQMPDRRIFDQQTPPSIVEKIPGAIREAPIHLPLRITHCDMSEDTAPKVAVKDTEALKIAGEPFDLEQLVAVGLEQLVLDSIKLRQEETIEKPPCSEPKSTV